MKFIFLLFLGLLPMCAALGNNVRVVGNVTAPAATIVGDIVTIKLTLEWENSWRDAYNHDAVYLVLKYRTLKNKTQVWNPVYLRNDGHSADNGFTWTIAPGITDQRNTGVFVHRSFSGNGIARTNVELKWDFKSTTSGNGVDAITSSDFYDGKVIFACIGIEMVYIPRGAFALGDMANTSERNASDRTFMHKDTCITASEDEVDTRYWIETNNPGVQGHPASLAANRENDLSNSESNAWVGNGDEVQSWTIDFGRLADGTYLTNSDQYMKAIQFMSIESIPGRVPRKWRLVAAVEDLAGAWKTLREGTASDWVTSLERVYPPTKAFRVQQNPLKYRFYRLQVDRADMPSASVTPVIKAIAMTSEDLGYKDYTFIVDSTDIALGGVRGLNAMKDGETWAAGRLPATYPNGYGAFYVMKYEMSQEQYAGFLQLLPPAAQKARTIGNALASLPARAFVFGGNPDQASERNGIVISTWNSDTASFGCNLDTGDVAISVDGDGMPIACNYLTPADMLAYASWIGLRPLTELEYERMSREPFPAVPLSGSCAWGGREATPPGTMLDAGKSSERLSSGNANFKSVIPGPARVGIFASSGTKQVAAGASFWGVMDLSGNLSEIYYNANTEGRKFNASTRSNAILPVTGIANVSGWVSAPGAFGVRGGNYKSVSSGELATSLRSYARGYITDINERDSTLSFRLGVSCTAGTALKSVLTLENGLTTEGGSASDTVCAGGDYRVIGNEPAGNFAVNYIWYKSENLGKTWEIMKDQCGKDIALYDLKNAGMADNYLREYWLKRKAIRDNSDGVSAVVKLKVIDPTYTVSRLRDTLDGYGKGAGITVTAKYPTVYKWNYLGKKEVLPAEQKTAGSSYYLPARADLYNVSEGELHGTKLLTVHMNILNTCERSEVISVHTINVLDKDLMKVKDFGTYRAWADGTYAPSADAYRHPKNCPYEYRGATGSGIYRIDPDGRSGPIEPFDVYCDMETEGGGWSILKIDFREDTNNSGTESNVKIFSNISYNLTAQQIVGLKAVSREGRQYFSKKCYHSVANTDDYCRWDAYGGNVGHYYDWPNYGNCTPNDATWRQAAGEVRNVNLVPIMNYYGDETGNSGEYAKYTFGDVWFR